MNALVPKPRSVEPGSGAFTIAPATRVIAGSPELLGVGRFLAGLLRAQTGYAIPVSSAAPRDGDVVLEPGGTGEGYALAIGPNGVTIKGAPAGVFYGVQTLRQLVPLRAPWRVPAGAITDAPRFAWRGAMLDVARHFFGVADVKRFIDAMAAYKLNRLHLHLSDDQGWRIAIRSWPKLAQHGGSTAVGGGPGGYYTRQQYTAARRLRGEPLRHDRPRDRHARARRSGAVVVSGARLRRRSASALHGDRRRLQLAVHDEGDQRTGSSTTSSASSPRSRRGPGSTSAATRRPRRIRPTTSRFVERVQRIVRAHGKQLIGWEEIGPREARRRHGRPALEHRADSRRCPRRPSGRGRR